MGVSGLFVEVTHEWHTKHESRDTGRTWEHWSQREKRIGEGMWDKLQEETTMYTGLWNDFFIFHNLQLLQSSNFFSRKHTICRPLRFNSTVLLIMPLYSLLSHFCTHSEGGFYFVLVQKPRLMVLRLNENFLTQVYVTNSLCQHVNNKDYHKICKKKHEQ